MTRVTGNKPKPIAPVRPGSGGVIRPMYGVFIRDQVAKVRTGIQVSLSDLKAGIAAGKPNSHEIPGDGVLEGSELTRAKKAAADLDRAIKALQPVFANLGPAKPPSTASVRADLGRPTDIGHMVPMYGVILRDDLRKFRTEINGNVADIQKAINAGELKGPAKTEAQKALRYLQTALKDLGAVSW